MSCSKLMDPGLAPDGRPKALRVYVDGCFDLSHYGHCNLIRQAAKFGFEVVVGIHSDQEIRKHKGPPVSTEDERYYMMARIKWVTQIVPDAPYVTTKATLDKYQCQFVIHGNDLTYTADGTDTYLEVKLAGLYRESERSCGASTSNLVKRMLLIADLKDANSQEALSSDATEQPSHGQVAKYIGCFNTIADFANNVPPKPNDKVILVVGAFDLFNKGHLMFLEKAKKLGSYLIIGLFSDEVVKQQKGKGHPVLSICERAMSVLSFKPTDDVLIGLPYTISAEILDQFNIQVVANGIQDRDSYPVSINDPFAEAKRRGIYVEIDSGSKITTTQIIEHVVKHKEEYEERNRLKEQKERDLAKSSKLV